MKPNEADFVALVDVHACCCYLILSGGIFCHKIYVKERQNQSDSDLNLECFSKLFSFRRSLQSKYSHNSLTIIRHNFPYIVPLT